MWLPALRAWVGGEQVRARGQDQFSPRREGGGTRVAVRVLVLVARPRGCETVTRRATAVARPDA